MKESGINIVVAPNDDVINPTCALISSIIANTKGKINFYICYFNLTKRNIERLNNLSKKQNNCNIIFKKFDQNKFDKAVVTAKFPLEIFIRLIAPYSLKVKKFLYLDCDTIAKADLSKLYATDISSHTFAATKDAYSNNHIKRLKTYSKSIISYYNSGVMLINCERFTTKISLNSVTNYINGTDFSLWYPDQDLINILFDDKEFLEINKNKYNQFNIGPESNLENFKNATIIHYAGNQKPWRAFSSPIQKCYFKEYWRNANACGIHMFPSYWALGIKHKIKTSKLYKRVKNSRIFAKRDS